MFFVGSFCRTGLVQSIQHQGPCCSSAQHCVRNIARKSHNRVRTGPVRAKGAREVAGGRKGAIKGAHRGGTCTRGTGTGLCWQNAFFSFCSNFRSGFFVLARMFPACVPVHFQIFSFCPNVCSPLSVLRSDPQNVRPTNPGMAQETCAWRWRGSVI